MREIIYALESIDNPNIIKEFIKRQDINGCSILINTLRYVNKDTEERWLLIYNNLFKY